MNDKNIHRKPWIFPPSPDFKNILVYTKEEHAAQADIPLAINLMSLAQL
jgi:hypothetical protein